MSISSPTPASRTPSITIDAVDRELVDRLRADGRASNRSLGVALGINETTVASRLRRLEGAQVMRVVAVTDMDSFGLKCMGFALIRVTGRSPRAVAEDVAQLPEAIGVSAIVGGFDVAATLLTRDVGHLAGVVGESIRGIPGVDSALCELAVEVPRFDSRWAGLRLDADPLPRPEATDGWDPLDLSIIAALQLDARSSNRSIAAALGVSEATVRGRLRRMEASDSIRIQAVCDVEAFGLRSYAFVAVRARDGRIPEAQATLLREPTFGVVARTVGGVDFIGLVVAETRERLLDVVFARVAQDPAIHGIQVFETCGTVKHVYTWARLT